MDNLIEELKEATLHLSGSSIRNGCVDCGLASNTANNALDHITALTSERDALRVEVAEARNKALDEALDPAAMPSPVVRDLVWDIDGRQLRLDDGMVMGEGYDWDGYEVMREEAYGLNWGYIIWPDSISSKSFSLYCTLDGAYWQSLTEQEARSAAQAHHNAAIISTLIPARSDTDNALISESPATSDTAQKGGS